MRLPIFYGWVVVAVAFVTMAIGVNARTSFSLLFPPILDEFGWERGTTAAAFSLGFILFVWYAVQAHQTKYLIDIGFTSTTAAFALGLVPLLGIGSQIALGHLSDRVGREWAWTLSGLGFILCYALLLVLEHHAFAGWLYLMVTAQGLGYGLASVYGAIPAELFQGRHYGTVFGMLGFGSGLGAGIGPWIAGTIHDRTGSYALAFWVAIALGLVSVAAVWLAAPRKVRAVAGRVATSRA